MRNRADNPYRVRFHMSTLGVSRDWGLDRHPALRIAILFIVILLAFLAIASRLAYVQGRLTNRYAAEFDRTIEQFEPIPSHDGRILAADGEVLAEDHEVFGLAVHYRWLEEPPNPLWLKSQ